MVKAVLLCILMRMIAWPTTDGESSEKKFSEASHYKNRNCVCLHGTREKDSSGLELHVLPPSSIQNISSWVCSMGKSESSGSFLEIQ